MIERRDQADSVGRHAYRPSSPLATAVGLMLYLTQALTQPSVGTAASASLEFMGLHLGLTLDQVEQALEQQGLDLPKLFRTPSFETDAAQERGSTISSEALRVGKTCGRRCQARAWQLHKQKNTQ